MESGMNSHLRWQLESTTQCPPGHHTGRRENIVWDSWEPTRQRQTAGRECHAWCSWNLEGRSEWHLPALTGVEASSCLNRGQVLVVGPDNEGLFGSLRLVPPFLQSQFHWEKLPGRNILVFAQRGISDGSKRHMDGVSGVRRITGTVPRQLQSLGWSWGIGESKGHNQVLKMTNWRVESGFPFAPPSYSNQMVGIPLRPELIKGREYLFFTVMFF